MYKPVKGSVKLVSKFSVDNILDYAMLAVSLYLFYDGAVLEGIFGLLFIVSLKSIGNDE